MVTSRIKKIIGENDLILMEGAVVEILRRSGNIKFHPDLIHAQFVYDKNSIDDLKSIYKSYLDIAGKTDSPFIIGTPTWRANKENVYNSEFSNSLNIDAVKFMQNLRSEYPNLTNKILIAGVTGPKNDCYRSDQGLTMEESEAFHCWQIDQLKTGGVDFIIAETLPNLNEAMGIAKACSNHKVDYFISFVISRNGKILDQSDLLSAIRKIDDLVDNVPLGYFVNCAHPSFLCAENQPGEIFKRFIGFLGNASNLDHCDLDNAIDLHTDDIANWGNEMLKLHYKYGIKILGGCCGTNANYIDYLRSNLISHRNR